MDRKVRKDVTRRYNAMVAQMEKVESNAGETDTFCCSECGKAIRTVKSVTGVIPMGIECPYCHGEAFHEDEDNKNIPVTHEWYRPTLEETIILCDGNLFTASMVLSGGLLRREFNRK